MRVVNNRPSEKKNVTSIKTERPVEKKKKEKKSTPTIIGEVVNLDSVDEAK